MPILHSTVLMARRIAAILLLEAALDANYRAAKAATYGWPAEDRVATPSQPWSVY